MSNKTLRGNTDIYVAYLEAFADKNAPTTAELNSATLVTLVSCAVNDDYKLNRTDSDTDNTQSVCDVSQVETPTFDKYEGALNIFTDADQTATGVYNKARDLFKNKGVEYIIGKRIGRTQGAAFAINDVISMYHFKTDNPKDVDAAGSPLQMAASFKPQGWVLTEYKVVA